MSSEESTTISSSSSRLSQFGLYRTIDARTEEFLKLSKKRQIRQGCACAIISTALTVTIVVAVLLIYEHNGYSDPNPEKEFLKTSNITKTAHKERNRHEENSGNVNKNKHIISTSTINLLNLLLKALNHTQTLEGQENISNSLTFDKLDETDTPFKRNVFSDIKNWIRIPNFKMLAEHKTPSIFYYRNPTKNVKLTTNTRKPSIFPWTYISKASEEVLDKDPTSSDKTYHPGIPIIMETTTTLPKIHINCSDRDGPKTNCNCIKQTAFVCKVLSNIQELFPGVILNTTLCSFSNNVIIQKGHTKNAATSTPLNKITVSKTALTPTFSDKNKAHEKFHAAKIFQGETGKSDVTEDIYKDYKTNLLANTNKLDREGKSVKTHNFLNKSTELPLKNYITTESKVLTTSLRPYIVAPELVEYLKYYINSTTVGTTNKSARQHKSLEKLNVTDPLDKYIDTTAANKTFQNVFVTDKQKATIAAKSYQHETSSERKASKAQNSVTIRNFIAINKEDKKYSFTDINKYVNFRKIGIKNYFQNKKNKIISKSPMKSVIKTIKKITERPEYTTVTVRPYIIAPEPVENSKKSTTTAKISTIATTVKHHEIRQNLDNKNILDRKNKSTEIRTQETAATKKKSETEQNFDVEKELAVAINRKIMKTQNETSKITATAIKYDENEHNSDINNVFDRTTTGKEITIQDGLSSVAMVAKLDKIEKKNRFYEIIRSTETTTQDDTSAADALKQYTIEQNLDTENALVETIRNMEIMTQEKTSTEASSKECDKIKQNSHTEKVSDGFIRIKETTIHEGTSTAASPTKHNTIEQMLDIENALDGTVRNTIKPTQTKTVATYFKDDFYEVNQPFKDIKFARFDSFAANSNKHIILPSYKDLNFELFPVFKRHNTNAPKLDTSSELLVNKDSRTANEFSEIMSSNKKDYYQSASNEIVSTISAKDHDTINKKIHIKYSMPIEETSPVNWIFEIKMMNDKIKETLKENFNNKNKKTNTVLRKSTESQNQNIPKIFSMAEKHPVWTYNIDNDYAEITTTKLKLDDGSQKYETTETTVMKNLPDAKLSKTNSNKQDVSIGQLYDTNESLLTYLDKKIKPQSNETEKTQLNISYSEESIFFEDRIQEKLKFLRDTRSKQNNDAEVTVKYLIPNELMADDTEYNPSSMLPKSRPSYLEINRNFLNIDEDHDYQMNKLNYKQKRQDFDYLYDILK